MSPRDFSEGECHRRWTLELCNILHSTKLYLAGVIQFEEPYFLSIPQTYVASGLVNCYVHTHLHRRMGQSGCHVLGCVVLFVSHSQVYHTALHLRDSDAPTQRSREIGGFLLRLIHSSLISFVASDYCNKSLSSPKRL